MVPGKLSQIMLNCSWIVAIDVRNSGSVKKKIMFYVIITRYWWTKDQRIEIYIYLNAYTLL